MKYNSIVEAACNDAIAKIALETRELMKDYKTNEKTIRRLSRERNMYHSFFNRINKQLIADKKIEDRQNEKASKDSTNDQVG